MRRTHWITAGALLLAVLACLPATPLAKKDDSCEVCRSVLTRVLSNLSTEDLQKEDKVHAAIRKFCKSAKDKDERFCYYVGGTADAATGLLKQVSGPAGRGVPADKICQRLSKADSQICDLRYPKPIDLSDLSKLKVKDLKKVLAGWGQECKGCAEKADFVRQVESLRPTFDPTFKQDL